MHNVCFVYFVNVYIVVYLTHTDFCCCGFLLEFQHVLYVSHKLNLLMLSSRFSLRPRMGGI